MTIFLIGVDGPIRKIMSKIKCPKCGSFALTQGMSSATLKYCPRFSDEDGFWHIHDSNAVTNRFQCRKCHYTFAKKEKLKPCWCGWSNSGPLVEMGNE